MRHPRSILPPAPSPPKALFHPSRAIPASRRKPTRNPEAPDKIAIPQGMYLLSQLGQNEDEGATGDLDILDDLVIRGLGDPTDIVVRAGGDFTTKDRVIDVPDQGKEVSLQLENITLRDGKAAGAIDDFGGAVRFIPSGLTSSPVGALILDRVVAADNDAFSGGAVYARAERVEVTESELRDNSAFGAGALFFEGDDLTLLASRIINNDALMGGSGGIDASGPTLIRDSLFHSNYTDDLGGALYGSGPLRIEGTAIINNSSRGGGGIFWYGGSLEVVNSTISYNQAVEFDADCGAILIHDHVQAVLAGSTVAFNLAGSFNPGTGETEPTVGGVCGPVKLRGSIIAGNEMAISTDLDGAPSDCGGAVTSDGYNLNADGSCGVATTGDLHGTKAEPLDPGLAPLLVETTTASHAVLDNSAAIDAVPVADCAYSTSVGEVSEAVRLRYDQRGIPRPTQGACDMGAYEVPRDDVGIKIQPLRDNARVVTLPGAIAALAILGSDSVDVEMVEATTLSFGPGRAEPLGHLTEPWFRSLSTFDVTLDGHEDLVAAFKIDAAGLETDTAEACLRGLLDGLPFESCESIEIVEPSCGIGFELALAAPALIWLRRHKCKARRERSEERVVAC